MLSVEQCKKYLNSGVYTDQRIEEIRERLYQLASMLIEEYLKTKANKTGKERGI